MPHGRSLQLLNIRLPNPRISLPATFNLRGSLFKDAEDLRAGRRASSSRATPPGAAFAVLAFLDTEPEADGRASA